MNGKVSSLTSTAYLCGVVCSIIYRLARWVSDALPEPSEIHLNSHSTVALQKAFHRTADRKFPEDVDVGQPVSCRLGQRKGMLPLTDVSALQVQNLSSTLIAVAVEHKVCNQASWKSRTPECDSHRQSISIIRNASQVDTICLNNRMPSTHSKK